MTTTHTVVLIIIVTLALIPTGAAAHTSDRGACADLSDRQPTDAPDNGTADTVDRDCYPVDVPGMQHLIRDRLHDNLETVRWAIGIWADNDCAEAVTIANGSAGVEYGDCQTADS